MNPMTTRKTNCTRRVLAGLAVVALTAPLGIAWAATKVVQTAPKTGAGYIPINGKRVVLILPLQTGASWTANPVFTRNLKQRAVTALREAMLNTGQFSLIEVNRDNPILQRGVIDAGFSENAGYTQEELDAFLADPTPETARSILSKITFDRVPKLQFTQAPLIAQMTLDTYPTKPGSATVQVTGNLYEMGADGNTIFRTKTVVAPLTAQMMMPAAPTTKRSSRRNKVQVAPMSYRTSDLLLGGLATAFKQVAADFARPLQEAESPFVSVPVGPILPAATPVAPPAPVNPEATPVAIPTEVPPAPAEAATGDNANGDNANRDNANRDAANGDAANGANGNDDTPGGAAMNEGDNGAQ